MFLFLPIGIICGLTFSLPVSSTGLFVLFASLFGLQADHRIFSFILLGILLGSAVGQLRDLRQLFVAFLSILIDLIANIKLLFSKEKQDRRKLSAGNYRMIFLQCLLAMIVMTVIGLLLGGMIEFVYGNLLATAMCFLVAALLLLVSTFSEGNDKIPKKMKWMDGIVLGLFEGFSFFPGISKMICGLSAGWLSGLSGKLTVKFCQIIALYGIGLTLLTHRIAPDFYNAPRASLLLCLPVGIVTAIAAYFGTVSFRSQLNKKRGHFYSIVNVVLAAILIILYITTKGV